MRSLYLATTLLVLPACEGLIVDATPAPTTPPGTTPAMPLPPGVPPPATSVCQGLTVGETPITRLTRVEYQYAVADLFGQNVDVQEVLAVDELTDTRRTVLSSGFEVGRYVSPILAEQYLDVASNIAAAALASVKAGCGGTGAACATNVIENIAPRAYRRQLSSEQSSALMALYNAGVAIDGHDTGMQLLVEGILTAPEFLYRMEGENHSNGETTVLDGYERASRLAFFLWRSVPDQALLAAAAAGQLDTDAGMETQARRMLADSKAQRSLQDFFRQWARLDALDSIERDAELFPNFTPQVAASMKASAERFLAEVAMSGTLTDLYSANYAYVDRHLAPIFGVTSSSDSLERVTTDSAQRAGILTHPAILAILSHKDQNDPIHRGLFVQQRLLCNDLPSAPAGLQVTIPPLVPGETTRQRFATHRSDPSCSGCHQDIDPIGFGFENYDAVGAFRTTEEGLAIDASGQVADADFAVDFSGAVQLSQNLAGSDMAGGCFTRQWLRFALQRTEVSADSCSVATAFEDLSGGSIADLLVGVTTTQAFTHRHIPAS